jgi:hypothetical protein
MQNSWELLDGDTVEREVANAYKVCSRCERAASRNHNTVRFSAGCGQQGMPSLDCVFLLLCISSLGGRSSTHFQCNQGSA